MIRERVMRNNVERCPYCGWFMRYEDSAEWGEAWVCARQAEHIIADPENWSVDVIALGDDAVDTDGDPIGGFVGAHRLTPDQLRVALGITESTDPHPADADSPTDQAGTSGAENHTNRTQEES